MQHVFLLIMKLLSLHGSLRVLLVEFIAQFAADFKEDGLMFV